MELKNRLVRSATVERMGDDKGLPTPDFLRLYERLAKGGVGLIITGMTFYVSPDGKTFRGAAGIDRDEGVSSWRALTDHVHGLGTGAKIAMQIAHGGRRAHAGRYRATARRACRSGGAGERRRAVLPVRVQSRPAQSLDNRQGDLQRHAVDPHVRGVHG